MPSIYVLWGHAWIYIIFHAADITPAQLLDSTLTNSWANHPGVDCCVRGCMPAATHKAIVGFMCNVGKMTNQ